MLRSLLRSVAHARMKKKGLRRVNKKHGNGMESFFSNKWREYAK